MAKNKNNGMKNNASNNSKNTSGSSKNNTSGSSRIDTGGSMKDTHSQVPGSGSSRNGPGGEQYLIYGLYKALHDKKGVEKPPLSLAVTGMGRQV